MEDDPGDLTAFQRRSAPEDAAAAPSGRYSKPRWRACSMPCTLYKLVEPTTLPTPVLDTQPTTEP